MTVLFRKGDQVRIMVPFGGIGGIRTGSTATVLVNLDERNYRSKYLEIQWNEGQVPESFKSGRFYGSDQFELVGGPW